MLQYVKRSMLRHDLIKDEKVVGNVVKRGKNDFALTINGVYFSYDVPNKEGGSSFRKAYSLMNALKEADFILSSDYNMNWGENKIKEMASLYRSCVSEFEFQIEEIKENDSADSYKYKKEFTAANITKLEALFVSKSNIFEIVVEMGFHFDDVINMLKELGLLKANLAETSRIRSEVMLQSQKYIRTISANFEI